MVKNTEICYNADIKNIGSDLLQIIGKIDIEKFKGISENIITDEVIITDKQIEHIGERHNGVYDKYKDELANLVNNPDYILKDPKHDNTALLIKHFEKYAEVVLRLNVDSQDKSNSIITIWEIKESRFNRYLLTHDIVYKRE